MSIESEYLVKEDMAIIEAWARDKKKICISFRPAGEKTLNCLKRGAGAKPHEILDKTLKRKEEGSPQNGIIDAFFAGFGPKIDKAKELLEGLVGHWIDDKKVDGLYLTSIGYEDFNDAGGFVFDTNKNSKPYLKFENDDQKTALISNFEALYKKEGKKAYYLFTRRFFSGDYDVHDLLWHRWPVPTSIDMKLLKDLQTALIAGRQEQLTNDYGLTQKDFERELKYAREYRRVQHGPQFNYTAQMLNENNALTSADKINLLVENVMNMDPPVAVYDNCVLNGQWNILFNGEEVKQYYKQYGKALKETWSDSPEGRERFIRNNIKRIAKLCFPDAGLGTKVTSKMLLDEVPQLKEVYGKDYEAYADAALKEL